MKVLTYRAYQETTFTVTIENDETPDDLDDDTLYSAAHEALHPEVCAQDPVEIQYELVSEHVWEDA